MLGTNPIAIAFPGHEEPPIVIDLATPVVPLGKIEIALRKGEPIPLGWAIDAEGQPTDDPQAARSTAARCCRWAPTASTAATRATAWA